MPHIKLEACTARPLGGYLKSLGVLRLVAEQADAAAQGWWEGDTFQLQSNLAREGLMQFFLDQYAPTPIVAPWNSGSGFYGKEDEALQAILATTDARFVEYRAAISGCLGFPEVKSGRSDEDKLRKAAILRRCRNRLPDSAVEWLDAVMGVAADESLSFPPILGTGGNDGRLEYTNNFMSRLRAMLIEPAARKSARELLENALFAERTGGLQNGAAGQYDPGRAGGANQGAGIEADAKTNPWDLILTMEGTVAWASGLYRRQGIANRAVLCSPFTVYSKKVGYGSASEKDESRAEVWTPLWSRPVRYAELRVLLREGRASISGRAAQDTLEFAEAAASLGVDRGIEKFVRYSLVVRRGKSYVALPTGTFPTGYRRNVDRIRELRGLLERLRGLPKAAEDRQRSVDGAIYQVLLADGGENMRAVMAAVGRMLRRAMTTSEIRLPATLDAVSWLQACGFDCDANVRVAAAIASIHDPDAGSIGKNLSRAEISFAWTGINLPDRMISVLGRRIQSGNATSKRNPLRGRCDIDPGDVTLFIEGSLDDALIEDLLFGFQTLNWKSVESIPHRSVEVLPVYAVVKALFLPDRIKRGGEFKFLPADRRILSALSAGAIGDAADLAVQRLRIAGLSPLTVPYPGGVDARRLAAALLIPVWAGKLLNAGIFKENESYTLEENQ
jgi:CRISPR-associated protein Csx17